MSDHGPARKGVLEDSGDDFVLSQKLQPAKMFAGGRHESRTEPLHQQLDEVFPTGDVKLNYAFSLNKVYTVFTSFVGEKKKLL